MCNGPSIETPQELVCEGVERPAIARARQDSLFYRAGRSILAGILLLLVYVASFHLAGRVPAHGGLDPSWHAVLEYASARDLRFGHDLIYTYGPLGYLYGEAGTGELMGRRVAFALLWSAVVAVAVFGLMRRVSGPVKLLFPVLFVLLADFTSATLIVMVYAGWRLLEEEDRWWLDAALCLLLSVLGLLVFTHLIIAAGTVAVVMAVRLLRRQHASAGRLAVLAPGVLVLLWVSLNQRLHDLPRWLAGGGDLVLGYSEAMSLPPNPRVLLLAVAAMAAMIGLAGLLVHQERRSFAAWGLGVLLLMHTFVVWKHGFVRADDHVYRFLYFLPLLGCLGLAATFRDWTRGRYIISSLLLALLIGLCVYAGAFHASPVSTISPGIARQSIDRLRHNTAALRLVAAALRERDLTILRTPAIQDVERLTTTPAIVGDEPIDVMNYQQGLLLAGGLNYRPRPVFQSFAAYTQRLQQRNLDFYRSDARPQYLLYHLATIDQRYPSLDDAPLLPLILHNYQPVAVDGMMLLLRQLAPQWEEVRYELVHEQTLALDDMLDLSPWNDRPIFAEVEMEQSFGGGLLKLAFQPVPVMIETRTAYGEMLSHRFVPSMGRRGFLLSPRLLGNDDVVSLWSGGGARLEQVRFSLPRWRVGSFRPPRVWREIRVRLYQSSNFLEHHQTLAGEEALRPFRSQVFNVPPLEFSSSIRVESIFVNDTPALMVHAPGQVLLEAPDNTVRLSGRFGIRERAYTGDAETDGVIFIVELEGPDGARRRAFERHLRPMEQAGDRGMQTFEVELDSADRRIILITDPAGDLRYDWSYWADVKVE